MPDPGSDIAKFLHQLGVNDETTSAVDKAAGLAAGVSSLVGAYSIGKSVLQFIGGLPKDKTVDDVLNAIESLKNLLEGAIKTLDTEVLSLGKLVSRIAAWNALAETRNFREVAIFAAVSPEDPKYQGELIAILANIGSDINRLAPGDWWKQIYSTRIYYSDAWTGRVDAGENDGQLAFDYRVQLASYLEALSTLMLIRMVGGAGQKAQLFEELSQNLIFLEDAHDKILASFARVPIPTESELKIVVQLRSSKGRWYVQDPFAATTLPSPNGLVFPVGGWGIMDEALWASTIQSVPGGNWIIAQLPYGLAEGLGGLYDVQKANLDNLYVYSPKIGDEYKQLRPGQLLASVEWTWDQNEFVNYYGDFFSRIVLASVGSAYRLYWEATGLGKTRELIKQIAELIGIAPRPIDGSYTRWTCLSLKEALDLRVSNFKAVPCQTFRDLGVSLASFESGALSLRRVFYNAMSS
jgi:hypothetical protein